MIAFGKGVCGTAAANVETQLVPDVGQFPGHIACDSESASEIVVPIVRSGNVSRLTRGESYLSLITNCRSLASLILTVLR